jgi:hypothetical protein
MIEVPVKATDAPSVFISTVSDPMDRLPHILKLLAMRAQVVRRIRMALRVAQHGGTSLQGRYDKET